MENKVEKDRVVAKFMGVERVDNFYDGFELHQAGLPFAYGAMGNGTRDLSFTSSWDWLMPVVERIEELNNGIFQVDIKQEGCVILKRCKHFDTPIDKTVLKVPEGTTKIQSVYLAVVEFIECYNKC